jgi:hypothetical protein
MQKVVFLVSNRKIPGHSPALHRSVLDKRVIKQFLKNDRRKEKILEVMQR